MNSNVPSDVMELERDTFFDFVKQYSGEKVANLLEFQDITNVNCLLACKDPLEILLLDSDDLLELKKATCLKLNNNSFTVLPGVKTATPTNTFTSSVNNCVTAQETIKRYLIDSLDDWCKKNENN
ncbi:unnamed protein product [Rotaria magnacalcarata]|uniref:Uncharacterized protein n=1 Tax=Rotaria magnacalcarata TaxID=392030 RepID=A0A8S2J120_9BILA|nr:unnamed protein product [Rotaria magnacalcarata]